MLGMNPNNNNILRTRCHRQQFLLHSVDHILDLLCRSSPKDLFVYRVSFCLISGSYIGVLTKQLRGSLYPGSTVVSWTLNSIGSMLTPWKLASSIFAFCCWFLVVRCSSYFSWIRVCKTCSVSANTEYRSILPDRLHMPRSVRRRDC